MKRNEKREPTAVTKRWQRFWQVARPFATWIISIVLVVVIAVVTVHYVVSNYVSAVNPDDPTPYQVVIPQNASASKIAGILYNAGGAGADGLIVSTASFKIYVDFVGKANSLKAGTYLLSKNMTIPEIVDILCEGNPARQTISFTIPEGYTVESIAQYLVQQGVIDDAQGFCSLCRDAASFSKYPFLGEMSNVADRKYALEGYLFPDTYQVYVDATSEEIIEKMLTRYYEVYSDEDIARAAELNLTRDQVLTLASIIEREARDPEDFAKVSAVFHNRLAQGMKLESCATLSYITGTTRYTFTKAEMEIVSSYNTYLNTGLPVGPICNPGEAAIAAALYPNEQYLMDGYLYFCNGNPNESRALVFAKTYEEHQQNVAKYEQYWD